MTLTLAESQEKPRRTVLFLAVTAKEPGLLGSAYHAIQPPYPLANTVANINIDGINQWGRTTDHYYRAD